MIHLPIKELEWDIAKGRLIENLKNLELAHLHGISHENNVSRIYARFVKKIEQMEKDLCTAIELGLYEPRLIDRNSLSNLSSLDLVDEKKNMKAKYRLLNSE